jgi:hypothetical protein
MRTDGTSNSQARENQEAFTRANEQIRETAERYDFDTSVPFLCECAERTCMQSVRLSLTTYRKARVALGAFIVLPGHENGAVERVVARRDGYLLVEKFA